MSEDETPESDAATSSEQAAPSSEPSGPDEDIESDETLQQTATTIINVMRMQAENAAFGTATGGRPPSTGTLDVGAVGDALVAFRGSDAFERAQKILIDQWLVVIVGHQATGRYSAALGLLTDWPATPASSVQSLSPTTSVHDLAEPGLVKPGRRYLVHDIRGDGRASAEQRHDLSRLRPALRKAQSRLVVTAEPGALSTSDFGDVLVEWVPPACVEILQSHLTTAGVTLAPDDLDRARRHASTLARPHEVAAFVARIQARGLTEAMNLQSEIDCRQVTDWLDDPNRTVADRLTLTAACFLAGVPEHVFERCVARLNQLFHEHGGGVTEPVGQSALDVEKPWTRLDGLLRSMPSARFGERQVEFCSPYLGDYAIAEIWRRYGYRLIEPVRQWVDELVADTSLDVRTQAPFAVARLAESRWTEVEESFLVPWANDTLAHRLAAVNVLSAMASSEQLAPRALQLAIAWSDRQGQRRAMTAALALGGPLSTRYPQPTFEQLWALTARAQRIAAVARVALSLMLTCASAEPAQALRTLRYTVGALNWAMANQTPVGRRASTGAVANILAAPKLGSADLVIAELLQVDPEHAIEPIGILLAEVLASGPHHHGGVDVLRRLLNEIADRPENVSVADRLGDAVRRRWDPDQRQVLLPQVELALGLSQEEADLNGNVIRSFIRSIGRSGG